MGSRGQMAWLSGDVLDEIRDIVDDGASITEALRSRMGLPAREPENKPKITDRKDKRYQVMHLDVGESLTFKDISIDSLTNRIKSQSRGTGREFQLTVTADAIQVIRTQ